MLRGVKFLVIVFLSLLCLSLSAQERFFNLTAADVKIDSRLPHFSHSFALGNQYADSSYAVSILYPEFIDMTSADVARYRRLTDAPLPALPHVRQQLTLDRKKGSLEVDFCPLVFRDGKYQILVSFMLRLQAQPRKQLPRHAAVLTRAGGASRYASHSVLASGKWAKIRIPASGVYRLTDGLIRRAGFTDINKVRVYGYGGRLQNEKLVAEELVATDDLKEVPTCWVDGQRLFYAHGPVSWASNSATRRTRNPYSDYGYYFLTQTDDAPASVDTTAFLASFYPSPDDYHTLYEVDGYAWYAGGRNLFDPNPIPAGSSKTFIIPSKAGHGAAKMSVNLSAGTASQATVTCQNAELGTLNVRLRDHDSGNEAGAVYEVNRTGTTDSVKIFTNSGGPVHLDYISFTWKKPLPAPRLKGTAFQVPEYVYNITNQDLHGDGFADMVIIIPASQKLRAQAERLKAFHEQNDGLRVRIVPADELYNEFSSGTPDANAYRRYLKMLYDRAQTEADMPKYLLLFGDCVWDNRMLTVNCRNLNPDDYLLCFESENSFSSFHSYVNDGFFCALDDGEGLNVNFSDKQDVAVGRFPVKTEAEAKVMVDKVISYVRNKNGGAWQNTLVFMGDDGDNNMHMHDVNATADAVATRYPGYLVKKIMWDAYVRETSSTGNSYPEVRRLIKQQQAAGALIMDYGGHGSEIQISHEKVLGLSDFQTFNNSNLPLWVTASCDIMPFDGVAPTIGVSAVLNPKGGALAFFGTTRTVSTYYNAQINTSFLLHVLSKDRTGKPITLGEAQRLAKNEMIDTERDLTDNKLQYSLLGDPAVALRQPTLRVVVDSINGSPVSTDVKASLKAGGIAKVTGHVERAADFNGAVTVTVRDSKEEIVGRMNDAADTKSPFTYYDRTKTLFNGSANVTGGRFALTFAIPRDINNTDGTGLMNLYALSDDHRLAAHGVSEAFTIGGMADVSNDSIGPSIYCYLNSPSFTNGDKVNSTPYFVAKITDENGVNSAGSGIGHDLQLIIDGQMSKTYVLNDNFVYDFGSYTTGTTHYNIPELAPGPHKLQFRAWDVLNNSSTAELTFHVVRGMSPNLFSVGCTHNPARTATTFIINHDRAGALVDVEIDVFDMSGRQLWKHQERGVSAENTYTVDWDLRVDGGARLQTGVYLYRASLSSEGSPMVSKAKKLIVIGNN